LDQEETYEQMLTRPLDPIKVLELTYLQRLLCYGIKGWMAASLLQCLVIRLAVEHPAIAFDGLYAPVFLGSAVSVFVIAIYAVQLKLAWPTIA